MADNYLERKMEEYRSRKSQVVTAGRRKGVLSFAFPERKVLIVSTVADVAAEMVNIFSGTGSRVALFGNSEMASAASGARFYDLELTVQEAAIENLLEAWGDIDVIVVDTVELPRTVVARLTDFRSRRPYPNSYGGRLLLTGGGSLTDADRTQLEQSGFTVNRVESAAGNIGAVARMCAFLCIADNGCVNGATLSI